MSTVRVALLSAFSISSSALEKVAGQFPEQFAQCGLAQEVKAFRRRRQEIASLPGFPLRVTEATEVLGHLDTIATTTGKNANREFGLAVASAVEPLRATLRAHARHESGQLRFPDETDLMQLKTIQTQPEPSFLARVGEAASRLFRRR